jgi:hypothetical protein
MVSAQRSSALGAGRAKAVASKCANPKEFSENTPNFSLPFFTFVLDLIGKIT